MSAVAYPYLRLNGGAVRKGSWLVTLTGDQAMVLGDRIEHWDYTIDLLLTRSLELDVAAAAAQLEIPPDVLSLDLVVTIGVGGQGGARDRRIVWRQAVTPAEARAEIKFTLSGADLSEALLLTTEIILSKTPLQRGRLSPDRPGLRLWREDVHVVLEPAGQRFPIEAVSFRHLSPRPPESALFYVDAGHDLDQDFTASVRLFLNADQKALMERVSEGEETTLQLIIGQVMAQLLRHALADNDFKSIDAFPGSVRAVLGSWLKLAFPDEPLEEVRILARREPARFEAALSALAAAQVSSRG